MKTKKNIVLLHGWGVNARIWQPVIEYLKDYFEVFLLDLPGFGNDAQFDGDYTMQEITERVLAQAPKRAVWVAWSLGATVAMQAAITHPDRFSKLQLVSPTPKFTSGPDWQWGVPLATAEGLVRAFQSDFQKGMQHFLLLQLSGTDRRQRARALMAELQKLPQPTEHTLQASMNLLVASDLRTRLGNWSVETEVVVGSNDSIIPPAASRWIAERLGDARLVELETGHLVFADSPALFADGLVRFAGEGNE